MRLRSLAPELRFSSPGALGTGPAVTMCAGVAITAPFPGALHPVSSLHSVPRAAFGVAMLTLLRVLFLEGDAQ
jgi:hypothetical protein